MARREAILSTVRRSLGVRGDEAGRRGRVRERLQRPTLGLAQAQLGAQERIELFTEKLEGQGAEVIRVKAGGDVPTAVAALMQGEETPLRLRAGADPLIAGLPWSEAAVEIVPGPAGPDDRASLSHALTAAAETGTLLLASGPENPSTLNFLPDAHIVLIAAEDILGSYEEAWGRVRSAYGRRSMPRTVNWVSGPSRTADIEQTIVRGAHGPKRLAVIIIG
jgi:L-lactate dehydrogenase complex protein LldG